jgi:hypothetical protein
MKGAPRSAARGDRHADNLQREAQAGEKQPTAQDLPKPSYKALFKVDAQRRVKPTPADSDRLGSAMSPAVGLNA